MNRRFLKDYDIENMGSIQKETNRQNNKIELMLGKFVAKQWKLWELQLTNKYVKDIQIKILWRMWILDIVEQIAYR